MNAQRIYKEARPLFWPWCAVVLAGAIPLVRPLHSIAWISLFGFLLGITLLASLPFGDEFQHRTLSLLLSQPISRMKLWCEKLTVSVVAVASAAMIFSFARRWSDFQMDVRFWAAIGAAIIAMTASATFWTLLARSTLGGAALNAAAFFFIGIASEWAGVLRGARHASLASPQMVLTVTLFSYAGVMLWLGGRTLARFQATGGMAGDDLLTAGPELLPGAWVSWLRCRPAGAVLNLFRKEIRLLRPVWLISLLAADSWAGFTVITLLHPRGPARIFADPLIGLCLISMLTIAVLAGSLPLGEERTSGTHAWHLTLPLSARRQWFIKLCTALVAGLVGAWLLPLLIGGQLPDFWKGREMFTMLIAVLLLTFAAFWCACAVKGTVPAVLWVLPVMIAVYYAGQLGKQVGPVVARLFFSRFDPFANVNLAHAVAHFGYNAFFRLIDYASANATDSAQAAFVLAVITLVPTLIYAVIQSFRLFRAEFQVPALSVVRSLLPLATIAFLCNFSAMAFDISVGQAVRPPKLTAFFETISAIQKIPSGATKLDSAHPLQLTVADLAKAYPLSKSTRRLLGNSHITLSLDGPPHHGQFGCAENPQPDGLSAPGRSWYSAIIPLPDGSRFVLAFDPVTHSVISAGICGGKPPSFPRRAP